MKKGFTLAEILITLGIVGIVAAMTIPNLIAMANERATVAKLKETYSILQQGFRRAIDEYGEVSAWCNVSSGEGSYNDCTTKLPKILSEFVSMSPCPWDSCTSRSYTNRHSTYKTSISYGKPVYMLKNGTVLIFNVGNGDMYPTLWCKVSLNETNSNDLYQKNCGSIIVDLNGNQGPNVDGRDLFAFKIYQDGIAPKGRKKDTVWVDSFNQICMGRNPTINIYVGTCTAWVLENENMDYLHNSDLTW